MAEAKIRSLSIPLKERGPISIDLDEILPLMEDANKDGFIFSVSESFEGGLFLFNVSMPNQIADMDIPVVAGGESGHIKPGEYLGVVANPTGGDVLLSMFEGDKDAAQQVLDSYVVVDIDHEDIAKESGFIAQPITVHTLDNGEVIEGGDFLGYAFGLKNGDMLRVRDVIQAPIFSAAALTAAQKKFDAQVPRYLKTMNTQPTNVIDLALSALGTGREPTYRGKDYEIERPSDTTAVLHFNDGKSRIHVTVSDYGGMTTDKNATANKVFKFLTYEVYSQGFASPTVFPLQKLVDLHIYGSVDSARKHLGKVLEKIMSLTINISGTTNTRGKSAKKARTSGFTFIGSYDIHGKVCRVYPVQLEWAQEQLAAYTTYTPSFVFGLRGNAYLLADLIFMRARQNTRYIAKGEPFTITTLAICDKLHLPTVEYLKAHGRKYSERIVTPIDKAIAEVRRAAEAEIQEEGINASILIEMDHMTEATNIDDYLANGRIRVTLGGEWAEHFKNIREKQSAHVARFQKEKTKQAARRALKAEAEKAE